jgi:hypothetical protein
MMFGRARGRIDRDEAMRARPARRPAMQTQPRDDGGLLVTVALRRPRWQRWLGGSDAFEKTYGLDAVGRWVYEHCDGRRTVRGIARGFARDHQVTLAEAEIAVTTFLKTLTAKGVVEMAVTPRTTGGAGGSR